MKHLLALLTVSGCFADAISAATFTVTNTADTGAGSLRQTLTDAAASADKDTIQFNLTGAGPHTILVASALPDLAGDILDGTAAAGGVTLEYAQPQDVKVLTVTGTAGEVKGINFRSVAVEVPFSGYQTGLLLAGAGSHLVSACQFTGRQIAMWIVSPGNHVGGGTGARNRFASLLDMEIDGAGTTIKGNEFVASTAGVGPYSYQLIGINLTESASDTVIESDAATGAVNTFDGLIAAVRAFQTPGLVFRGNRLGDTAENADAIDSNGACLTLTKCEGFVIENNSFRRTSSACVFLSLGAKGRIAGNVMQNTPADQFQFPNTRRAIEINDAESPEIDIAGNVIGGMYIGIRIRSNSNQNYSGVTIHGNTIGLTQAYTATSEVPVNLEPNLLATIYGGIEIQGGASKLKIGGVANAATGHLGPNTILARYGIFANRTGPFFSTGLEFAKNRIAATAGEAPEQYLVSSQAIVLKPPFPGMTADMLSSYATPANDPLDPDTGINNLQNHPVLTGLSATELTGTLNSVPNSSFGIQCYGALKTGDRLQGVPVFIGTATATTGADGNASFTVPLAASFAPGMSFWATATDSEGNTSHYSDPIAIALPVISITPPAAGVKAREGTPFFLTLTKTGSLSHSTTVNLTVPGTVADLEVPSSVTFLPGEATKEVPITVTDDNEFERSEEFAIWLGTIVGGVAGQSEVLITIASSDPATVTVGSVTAAEGTGGTTVVTVPVHLNLPEPDPFHAAFTGTFPVKFKFSGGSATEIVDYEWQTASQQVLFGSGSFDRNIAIIVKGDAGFEPDETIQIEVLESSRTWPDGSPMLAPTGHTAGTLTITNDDPIRASIIAANQQITEGDAGGAAAVSLTVQLDAAPLQELRVQWQTVADSAAAGNDFTAENGEAVFAPGETSHVIDVAIAGDGLVDRWPDVPENFHVALTGSAGAVLTTGGERATISILDDDMRQITVADASITEGNAGTAVLTFTASVPAATGSPVSFAWSTADDTATGADYVALSGTVTIPAGEVSTTFGIEVKGDSLYEIDESFAVLLTNSVNGPLTTARVTGTIVNNDAAPTLILDDTVVTVGPDDVDFNAWFRVRTSAISGAPVQVQWNTQAGTAATGMDYTESNGALTIPVGERTRWIAVPVHGDNESEPDETFTLRITAAGGASVPGGGLSATATLKEVAISEFFPVPGVSNLYVIRFPTGKGQAYLVEQADSLDDESAWVGVYSIQGSGTTLTHTQYSDSPQTFFRVRVVSSPPPN